MTWFRYTVLAAVALTSITVVQVYLFFGSFAEVDRFLISQDVTFAIDNDFRSPNKDTVRITVINHSSHPVTIIGARTGCGCGSIEDIPIVVDSRREIFFKVAENIDRISKSKQRQRIVFFVETGGIKKIMVELPLFEFLVRH